MGRTLESTVGQTPAQRLRALIGELAAESGAGLSAQDQLDFLTAAEEVKGAVSAAQARVTSGFIEARDAARAAEVAAASGGGTFERARAERVARRAASWRVGRTPPGGTCMWGWPRRWWASCPRRWPCSPWAGSVRRSRSPCVPGRRR